MLEQFFPGQTSRPMRIFSGISASPCRRDSISPGTWWTSIAAAEPGRTALVWCDENGAEATFTFGQMAELSNRAATFFLSLGIGRGDPVMLILKRRYEYWFCLLALHKIGAIAIPATHLLTKKDIVYRNNAASVKAIVSVERAEGPGQRGRGAVGVSHAEAPDRPRREASGLARPAVRHGKGGCTVVPHADGEHRHEPPVLHLGDHGHAQDGAARFRLPPRSHPHGEILAERPGRRAAPHGGGHGMGQGGVGQDLRAVAVRLGRVRLRLRPFRPGGPAWSHREAPGHHASARRPPCTASSSRRT